MKLALILVLAVSLTGCGVIGGAVQGDIGKLQADLQAKKAEIVPRIQAGIAYANQVGDLEWSNCQQGILALMSKPGDVIPDISNPWINLEVIHQGSQAIQSGIGQSKTVQALNVACAAWYVREKAEIMAIAAKLAILVK